MNRKLFRPSQVMTSELRCPIDLILNTGPGAVLIFSILFGASPLDLTVRASHLIVLSQIAFYLPVHDEDRPYYLLH